MKAPAPLFLVATLFATLVFPHSNGSSLARQNPAHNDSRAEHLDVDLVVMDALVLQQSTGRPVGDLTKTDFVLYEDGVRQQIESFGRDTLPLSVILLVDRAGCLDPFGERVRRATAVALDRLGPQDEVALMWFADTTELVQDFSYDRRRTLRALDHFPPHDEEVEHCFNRAFFDAAGYMRRAGNPSGRRVIIVITGLTTGFECSGPSNEDARLAILESGSVVCGVVPTSAGQRIESGLMRAVTGIGGLFKVRTSSLKQLAEETGGEIVSEKADRLVSAFGTLVEHLRTRYTIGFVSTNTKKDGSYRKLRLDVWPFARKAGEKLVVRTRRGYVARLRAGEVREPALPRR